MSNSLEKKEKLSIMGTFEKINSQIARQQAGMYALSRWEENGDLAWLNDTSIIGTLPEEVNGSPVFLVYCKGAVNVASELLYPISDSSYAVGCYLKVYLQAPKEPEGHNTVVVSIVSNEELAQAVHHSRDLVPEVPNE